MKNYPKPSSGRAQAATSDDVPTDSKFIGLELISFEYILTGESSFIETNNEDALMAIGGRAVTEGAFS